MNDPERRNAFDQLKPNDSQLQPESVETRAQMDGFIREAFRQRQAPYETPLIHVVDDDAAFRTALVRQLKSMGFLAVGYPDAKFFLKICIENRPGCILLDCVLPEISGLELQQELRARRCSLPIIFMSGEGTIVATVDAMKAGAVDFLTKPINREVLETAIKNAVAQFIYRRTEIAQLSEWREAYAELTPRQRELMEGVVAGKPNKAIASDMGISLRTAKVHRAQVMQKMGVVSLAELVQIAESMRRDQPVSPARRA